MDAEFLPVYIKLIPFFFSMAGVVSSFLVYYLFRSFHLLKVHYIVIQLYNFFAKKWLFDFIYLNFIYKPFFFVSYFVTLKSIDRGLLEFFGPLGIVRYFNKFSINLNRAQSGFVFHYIFFSVLVVMFLIFYILINGFVLASLLTSELLFMLLIGSILLYNYTIKVSS